MGDSEYSALKEAIDTAMGKIKNAKNSIKSAINTAGASMHVHVDDTDTFRSYADAIRLMYQRIWSSDDGTDAPAKCIITNDDFPLSPQHNSGYIDINNLSADRFGDDKKYYAASSFIVDIQNPPVPIISDENYFAGKITSFNTLPGNTSYYGGPYPSEDYEPIIGNGGSIPHEYYQIEVGKYTKFCSVCRLRGSETQDYITFPGGLFISFTQDTDNSTVTILADGKDETFKFLGKWEGQGTWGIWQRLTGGN